MMLLFTTVYASTNHVKSAKMKNVRGAPINSSGIRQQNYLPITNLTCDSYPNMKYLFSVISLGLIGPYALAQEFRGYGPESMSCGRYVQEIITDPARMNVYHWWLAGFVTGTNYLRGRNSSTDAPGYELWIKNYCEANPLEFFIAAASKLDTALGQGAVQIPSQPNQSLQRTPANGHR